MPYGVAAAGEKRCAAARSMVFFGCCLAGAAPLVPLSVSAISMISCCVASVTTCQGAKSNGVGSVTNGGATGEA